MKHLGAVYQEFNIGIMDKHNQHTHIVSWWIFPGKKIACASLFQKIITFIPQKTTVLRPRCSTGTSSL
jgi:hypothetical protein